METNYKIGETYYYNGHKIRLNKIKFNCNHPLECLDNNGGIYTFTLDGREYTWSKPSLSTSPTEFIAPKEEKERMNFSEVRDRLIGTHRISEYIWHDFKPIKSCLENRIDNAIQLLKSEGYTITKQY